jgi:hypothetical protein
MDIRDLVMGKTLSVFFNIDRTYVSIVEPTEKGLDLCYLKATQNSIDLENIDAPMSQIGIEELMEIVAGRTEDLDKIDITIPSESVVVSQFPGSPNIGNNELKQLISLEIRQAYPQVNPEEFSTNIIPMDFRKDGSYMMLAVIIPNVIIRNVLEILRPFDLPINNIEISQLNSHSAFLYNYPERQNQTIAIVGVQDQFMDISIIKNNNPMYYNLISLDEKTKIGEAIEKEHERIVESIVDTVDAAYFFGTGLTKELYLNVWETSMLLNMEVGRLNAFRMLTTSLDDRDREYASRTMHLYPPSIGASFQPYHKRLKLY